MKQVNHNSREAVDFIHCLTLFVYIIPVVYHLVINKPLIIIIIIRIIRNNQEGSRALSTGYDWLGMIRIGQHWSGPVKTGQKWSVMIKNGQDWSGIIILLVRNN